MANVEPQRIGVRYSRPTLYLIYRSTETGKSRRRKMPLRVIDDAVTSLKTRINLSDVSLEIDRRHGAYLKYCSPTQIEKLIGLVCKHHKLEAEPIAVPAVTTAPQPSPNTIKSASIEGSSTVGQKASSNSLLGNLPSLNGSDGLQPLKLGSRPSPLSPLSPTSPLSPPSPAASKPAPAPLLETPSRDSQSRSTRPDSFPTRPASIPIDGSLDLNKLGDQELQKIKASMGTSFAQNQIKKGDPNFEYDLQKDFGPAVGKSDWDSSDSDEDSEKKPAEKQNVPISVPVATSISAESATAAKPIDARISPAAALNQNVGKDDEIDDEFSDQDIDDVLDALDFGDEDDNSRVKNSTKAAAAVTAKQSHSDAASALDTGKSKASDNEPKISSTVATSILQPQSQSQSPVDRSLESRPSETPGSNASAFSPAKLGPLPSLSGGTSGLSSLKPLAPLGGSLPPPPSGGLKPLSTPLPTPTPVPTPTPASKTTVQAPTQPQSQQPQPQPQPVKQSGLSNAKIEEDDDIEEILEDFDDTDGKGATSKNAIDDDDDDDFFKIPVKKLADSPALTVQNPAPTTNVGSSATKTEAASLPSAPSKLAPLVPIAGGLSGKLNPLPTGIDNKDPSPSPASTLQTRPDTKQTPPQQPQPTAATTQASKLEEAKKPAPAPAPSPTPLQKEFDDADFGAGQTDSDPDGFEEDADIIFSDDGLSFDGDGAKDDNDLF